MLNRLKRILALAACCWCAAVPTPAQAESPGLDSRALGVAEAMLDYCAKAYPSSAVKFQYEITRLTRGASAETVARVRDSEPYRLVHDAEGDFISKVDPHNAKKVCTRPLVARK
jgi:hypothetical protein